jgi:hypothetical protein
MAGGHAELSDYKRTIVFGFGREVNMEEKLYYKDEKVKITDSAFTVNHVSVPVNKIEKIMLGVKTVRLAVSFAVFLLSAVFVWAGCYFYSHCCLFGILLVIATRYSDILYMTRWQ